MLKALIPALILSLAVIIVGLAPPGVAADPQEYIDINPFLRKIPTAVPIFKAMSGTERETELALSSADLMVDTLNFTSYFEMLDRNSFLTDPRKSGIVRSKIKFHNWKSIGAELLITGGILLSDDIIEMELRLFDPFKGTMLVGKKYKGWMSNRRNMIHRFCSEIIFRLTGSYGVFNSKIAFLSTVSRKKEVFFCDFDGYGTHQFTRDKSIILTPAWSSDGNWIAYTSYVRGNPDLYIKHIHEKRGAIISRKGTNTAPAWVPGRFELAASLSFSGNSEIYLLTGEGKVIKRLTYDSGIDTSPTWSPDGSRMAFVSRRAGTPQIFIKDLASGQIQRLTFYGRYNTQPEWSPKGDRIAFSALENGETNVHVIEVETGLLMRLTQNTGNNESPSWSPDGSMIAFSSTREGPSRIFVMTAYGTDQRRLLTLPGSQTHPTWSPRIIN